MTTCWGKIHKLLGEVKRWMDVKLWYLKMLVAKGFIHPPIWLHRIEPENVFMTLSMALTQLQVISFQIISIFKVQFPFAFWSSAFETFRPISSLAKCQISFQGFELVICPLSLKVGSVLWLAGPRWLDFPGQKQKEKCGDQTEKYKTLPYKLQWLK